MSNILDNKIKELEESKDYECWYLVKQPTDFSNICYLVSFLEEYKTNEKNRNNYNLQQYIEKRSEEINDELENNKISKNYRALRVAAFFGLIKMIDSKYENAILTETFFEIKMITQGKFEHIELYQKIITRQIEKMFVSSSVDEEYEGIRENYRLYPIILLYKILLELGKSDNNNYSITMTEYRYLVATTEKYNDFLKTLLEIIELRQNPQYNKKLDVYRSKFDNRMNQALKQLDTLDITQDVIQIKPEKKDEIRRKVFSFESSSLQDYGYNYIDFLGSTKSLFDLIDEQKQKESLEILDTVKVQKIYKPHQRIFFGAPGTGKSYQLNKEAKEYFGTNYERVTFHPNYMYGNFVGTFKPYPKEIEKRNGEIEESITYEYVEGVLMRQLIKALNDPQTNYLLLIEEINRANVAAVFGDIFQLLDRDENGNSEYHIATSKDQRLFLEKANKKLGNDILKERLGDNFETLYLPNNFYIWATMNSADQGVMPMDTAFRRRWDFTYLGIDDAVEDNKESFENYKIKVSPNETALWNDFRVTINKKLASMNIPEDKFIGPFFISKSVLDNADINQLTEVVKNKVIMYLYEDVAKGRRNELFEENKHSTYSETCNNFEKDTKNLFRGGLDIRTEIVEEETNIELEDDATTLSE